MSMSNTFLKLEYGIFGEHNQNVGATILCIYLMDYYTLFGVIN